MNLSNLKLYTIALLLLNLVVFTGLKVANVYLAGGYYLSKSGASAGTMLGYDTAALVHTAIWGVVSGGAALALGA